jgi:hypothetical protein
MYVKADPFKKVFKKELTLEIKEKVIHEAKNLLTDLLCNTLDVSLAPAPEEQHTGHMIRVVNNRNPKWYREIYADLEVKRDRIVDSLKRLIKGVPSNMSSYDTLFIELIKDRLLNGYDGEGFWMHHDNEVRKFLGLVPLEVPGEENLGESTLIGF